MAFLIFMIILSVAFGMDYENLRNIYTKINDLEYSISKIKYIMNEKVNLDLMGAAMDFDLYCQEYFPQQKMDYKKAGDCWVKISTLSKKGKYSFNDLDIHKMKYLIVQWQYVGKEFVNFKLMLLETIYTYVELEKELDNYIKNFGYKEDIMEKMMKLF